ncbi:hypothetical protein GDO78_012401 [Eleutherodactylus coqui]|uniref:Uncharacterized protein n=1 Tax=Eleutherodactylus coqui TaxID=57060 RepID=A0A8J6EYY9_ELECQ|nr:hypothetical protein GDO78_012401 [Eleutherodactylus coqui]
MVLEQCGSIYMHCTIYIELFRMLHMDFLLFKKSQALILHKGGLIWPKCSQRLFVAHGQRRRPDLSNVQHCRAQSSHRIQSTHFKMPPITKDTTVYSMCHHITKIAKIHIHQLVRKPYKLELEHPIP